MKTTTKYRFSGILQNSRRSRTENPVLPARYFQVVTRDGESVIGLSQADLEGIDSVPGSRFGAGELNRHLDDAGSLSGWALWRDHEGYGVELSLRGRMLMMARDVLDIRELPIEDHPPAARRLNRKGETDAKPAAKIVQGPKCPGGHPRCHIAVVPRGLPGLPP